MNTSTSVQDSIIIFTISVNETLSNNNHCGKNIGMIARSRSPSSPPQGNPQGYRSCSSSELPELANDEQLYLYYSIIVTVSLRRIWKNPYPDSSSPLPWRCACDMLGFWSRVPSQVMSRQDRRVIYKQVPLTDVKFQSTLTLYQCTQFSQKSTIHIGERQTPSR